MLPLIIGVVFVAAALALIGVALLGGRQAPSRVEQQVSAIERTYAGKVVVRDGATDSLASPFSRRMRGMSVRLSPAGVQDALQRRLDTAGNPGSWTPDRILSYKGVALFAVGGVFALVGWQSVGTILIFGALGAFAGFFLPDLLLYNAGLRRQDSIRKSLPDVLDLLTVSVEAGLGFDAALSRVAQHLRGPLAEECVRVLQEMQIGKSREDALRAMATRTTVPELRTFVAALAQASDLGIPVGNVLREQAREMRVARRTRAEEQAQKLPVKIIFPVVLCIFPALFVVIIGPGVLNFIANNPFGH